VLVGRRCATFDLPNQRPPRGATRTSGRGKRSGELSPDSRARSSDATRVALPPTEPSRFSYRSADRAHGAEALPLVESSKGRKRETGTDFESSRFDYMVLRERKQKRECQRPYDARRREQGHWERGEDEDLVTSSPEAGAGTVGERTRRRAFGRCSFSERMTARDVGSGSRASARSRGATPCFPRNVCAP